MDNEMINEMTAEEKAHFEKIEAILTDEKNKERIESIKDVDEIIAFYEDNCFSYTEEQKEQIRKVTAEISAKVGDGELSEDDLESVAGGWSWSSFFSGGAGGLMLGALGGLIVCSNPVGWVVGACVAGGAAIGAGTVGSITGALEI